MNEAENKQVHAGSAEITEELQADVGCLHSVGVPSLLNQLADGVIIADAEGRIIFVNEAAERLHGAALLGIGPGEYSTAYQLFTEEGRLYPSHELPLTRAVLDNETVEGARWLIRRPDGSEVLATGSAMPIINDSGAPAGAVLILRDDTERSRTEKALRASEEFSRRVLASSPDCIKVLALDGRLEFMTEGGMCVMEVDDFGEIEGAYWPEVWQGQERAKAFAGIEEAKRGSTSRFQGFAKTFKGTPRWWDVTVSPINGPDGRPEKLLSVSRDITPIMEAEAVLRESEERLRETSRRLDAIISNTQMAVFLMDDRQHCVFANPAAEALTGYSFDEMQGRPLHDVIHHKKPDGSHYPLEQCPIDRAFPERAHTRGEELFVARDGSFYPVAFTASPVLDDNGTPIGTVIEARNITEQKARDAALHELNETLERRVEQAIAERDRTWSNARDLLAVAGTGGVFQAVNPAWEAILGWSPTEVIGRDFRQFLYPEDTAASEEALATASHRQLRPFENRYRHKDGSYRWISWVAAPENDLIYASGRDVTEEKLRAEELRRAQDALRQSQKMEAIGQLTGGIAHDFNNLLTVIRGSADLLRRKHLSEEKRERYVDAIVDTADRAAKLTAQLLAFARRQALQPTRFDAAKQIHEIADMLRTMLGSRIQLQIQAECADCFVEADVAQFETSLVNMVVNARDAMDGEGQLTIHVAAANDVTDAEVVRVSVTDTGHGIDAAQMHRIFEPFYTTKEVGKGTGLGLSQVYGFVKQSDGDITVESQAERGTTFAISLPKVAAGETPARPRQGLEGGWSAGGRVLVVEDNADVGQFARQILSDLGYEAVLEPDASSALARLEQEQGGFDLIFSDVVMPGMNGIEFGRRAKGRWPLIPVVLTSGYSHVLAEEAQHGFPLLQKPYSLEALSKTLREAREAQASSS